MEYTWTHRDLPVLKAAVEIYDKDRQNNDWAERDCRSGRIRPRHDRACPPCALPEPYPEPGGIDYGGRYTFIGPPTGEALRVVGQWPTPENLLRRLIAALEAAGDDETIAEPERGKFKQAAAWLGSFASQVAISALGGAGVHVLSG